MTTTTVRGKVLPSSFSPVGAQHKHRACLPRFFPCRILPASQQHRSLEIAVYSKIGRSATCTTTCAQTRKLTSNLFLTSSPERPGILAAISAHLFPRRAYADYTKMATDRMRPAHDKKAATVLEPVNLCLAAITRWMVLPRARNNTRKIRTRVPCSGVNGVSSNDPLRAARSSPHAVVLDFLRSGVT